MSEPNWFRAYNREEAVLISPPSAPTCSLLLHCCCWLSPPMWNVQWNSLRSPQ
ncbi:Phosphatidylinositol transfer protein CSR1 [Clarias magur]|uniref:Phosphatidylinositol transfer protein CSR1 n=1 Tax=Clarias magur TaxID=1594786 RepID=A0A8J4X7B3_CLAMG|nr:Phosphatidylinositol transfer protein CSR1 [Clarias magur]